MFTGIVDDLGSIVARTQRGPGARLTVACHYTALALGESISVAGVCLTVDRASPGSSTTFEADASSETLARTTLGSLSLGAKVNLERALLPTTRLGGHLVSGHVDATTTLVARTALGEAWRLAFELPPAIARFVAEKGSIAIDGASLTVNAVTASTFELVVIPHTLSRTTLADLLTRPIGAGGTRVNVEVDVLARYVARQLGLATGATLSTATGDEALVGALARAGIL